MKYLKSQMQQLIKENKELHTRFKELKAEHGLEKTMPSRPCTIQKLRMEESIR